MLMMKTKNQPTLEPVSGSAEFLREIQKASTRINQFESESCSILNDITKLESAPNADQFSAEFWQLRGHHRFAQAQINRTRSLIDKALHAYACTERRSELLAEIRKGTQHIAYAMRDLRLNWRDLSATYHFMLSIIESSA